MPVDRGGLRYTIEVENKFSGPLKLFSDQTKAAKRSWNDLKNNLTGLGAQAKRISTQLDKIANSTNRAATAARKANTEARARRTALAAEARALQQLETQTSQIALSST